MLTFHDQTYVTEMSLLCYVLGCWKTCDLSVTAYRKGTVFIVEKQNKKNFMLIKNKK